MRRRSSGIDGSGPARFTLWREVVLAYLAPALMAGAGGLATGQQDLLLAAFTSIAGTSAVVAALTGAWLQRRGLRRRWPRSTPRILLVAGFGIGAAALAGLAAWFVTGGPGPWIAVHHAPWLDRLRLDLPLSAALAAVIVTWHWRGAQRTRRHSS